VFQIKGTLSLILMLRMSRESPIYESVCLRTIRSEPLCFSSATASTRLKAQRRFRLKGRQRRLPKLESNENQNKDADLAWDLRIRMRHGSNRQRSIHVVRRCRAIAGKRNRLRRGAGD